MVILPGCLSVLVIAPHPEQRAIMRTGLGMLQGWKEWARKAGRIECSEMPLLTETRAVIVFQSKSL